MRRFQPTKPAGHHDHGLDNGTAFGIFPGARGDGMGGGDLALALHHDLASGKDGGLGFGPDGVSA